MGISSPPIPPSVASVDEPRLEHISLPYEWIEDYHPGGHHPVVLGDDPNGQHRVITKLGEGSYSSAWLARDLK